jgi:heme oxygenase (biliverdin-IX-beta and delta-forming)
MLSTQLKEQTKVNHQLLEKKMVAQIKSIRTKEDYAKLLSLFYSFFGGLEVAMDNYPDESFLPDQEHRRKSMSLVNDIVELDGTLPAIAEEKKLPKITSHLQTIGAMYVMEGSTLGGRQISKMISQQLNLPMNIGLSFFEGYGDQTENMWNAFKRAIDKMQLSPEEEAIIIDAANDTFLQFSNWFDAHAVAL